MLTPELLGKRGSVDFCSWRNRSVDALRNELEVALRAVGHYPAGPMEVSGDELDKLLRLEATGDLYARELGGTGSLLGAWLAQMSTITVARLRLGTTVSLPFSGFAAHSINKKYIYKVNLILVALSLVSTAKL